MSIGSDVLVCSMDIDLKLEGDKEAFSRKVAVELSRLVNTANKRFGNRILHLSHDITVFGGIAMITVVVCYANHTQS